MSIIHRGFSSRLDFARSWLRRQSGAGMVSRRTLVLQALLAAICLALAVAMRFEFAEGHGALALLDVLLLDLAFYAASLAVLRSCTRAFGSPRIPDARDVRVGKLLGRSPVLFEEQGIARALRGKTILVTGGAGSIGSELCRQIGRCEPALLVLLDKDESGVFYMRHELARLHPALELETIICDIRNPRRIEALFARHRFDFVFHAAAYKHVPLMEENPCEAISTNVQGTWNLADAAARNGCGKFILISSDKAVRPASVMGATKRVAELVLDAIPQGDTSFFAVRFGNVLGSVGSVVPLFLRQIAAGGPVTVTHPAVTRYFMTVEEAVELVLHASLWPGRHGTFMLDMGQPVEILGLAEDLIRLCGLEPHADVEIVFTGLRPGEKLHEELYLESEQLHATGRSKIWRVQAPRCDSGPLLDRLTELAMLLDCADDDEMVVDWLCRTVHEFTPGEHLGAGVTPIPLRAARGHSRPREGRAALATDGAVANG